MKTDNPNPERWWKNRRRMAWIAFGWIILQTPLWALLAVFNPSAVSSLTPVIAWSYGASMAVLMGYFGNTAIEEYVKNKQW